MTSIEKDDKELDTYLDGTDGLSQAYKKNLAAVPPVQADEAILAASRKAAGAMPTAATVPFSARWHVPVSIAAVVVLSVLVVFNLPNESDQVLYEPVLEEANPATVQQKTAVMERYETAGQGVSDDEAGPVPEGSSTDDVLSPSARAVPQSADLPESRAMDPLTMEEAPATDAVSTDILQQFIAPEMDFADQETAGPGRQLLEDSDTSSFDTAVNEPDTGNTVDILATARQEQALIQCTTPRPEVCAEIYMPVCAVRDTGIRCVTTPCDSTERIDYPNACSACRDPEVIRYTDGECPTSDTEVLE